MKLDRLLGILTVLLQNERMTAPELAEKFEVNRRTIGRDIDTLSAKQESLSSPIRETAEAFILPRDSGWTRTY